MKNEIKCINIDWLEVYCLEPAILNADYFANLGWDARKREYGTPQYQEMFTLYDNNKPFIEIRRNPYSIKNNGGIFEPNACHIRLSNRTCYYFDAVQQLRNFLLKYGYTYKGISRIDICCDQIKFDNGMLPQKLANSYMADKIWKIHQSAISAYSNDGDDTHRVQMNIGAHGRETNTGRMYNSLKWGSPSSPISTKLYNKSLELSTESRDKWYIRDAWCKAGLCEYQKVTYDYYDPKTKKHEQRAKMVMVAPGTSVTKEIPIEKAQVINVWRVEFSIKSEGRNWVDIVDGHRVKLSLDAFDNLDKIAYTFFVCQFWLFTFCYAEKTESGRAQRKDRCKPLKLYLTSNIPNNYKPSRPTSDEETDRMDKIMVNRLRKMAKDKDCTQDEKDLMLHIAVYISKKHRDWLLPDPDRPTQEISLVLTHLRKENEDYMHKIASGQDTSWLECVDELKEMSIEDLNKNSNRFKRYQQKRVQAAKQKVIDKQKELKELIKRYEDISNSKLNLPQEVEELLGTPF